MKNYKDTMPSGVIPEAFSFLLELMNQYWRNSNLKSFVERLYFNCYFSFSLKLIFSHSTNIYCKNLMMALQWTARNKIVIHKRILYFSGRLKKVIDFHNIKVLFFFFILIIFCWNSPSIFFISILTFIILSMPLVLYLKQLVSVLKYSPAAASSYLTLV